MLLTEAFDITQYNTPIAHVYGLGGGGEGAKPTVFVPTVRPFPPNSLRTRNAISTTDRFNYHLADKLDMAAGLRSLKLLRLL